MITKEEFDKLSKTKKRIEIAKDVLKQLKARKLNVKKGDYCYINNEIFANKNLKNVLSKFRKSCEVCALGACFLSIISIIDNFVLDDCYTIGRHKMSPYLKLAFTDNQLDLIECSFEGWTDYFTEAEKKATRFHAKDSPEVRLKAIMKNIIQNNGTFKP